MPPKDFPSFTSNRPERESDARLDDILELHPAVSESRQHDRHGIDRVAGVQRHYKLDVIEIPTNRGVGEKPLRHSATVFGNGLNHCSHL
jgi:hypothetical protein